MENALPFTFTLEVLPEDASDADLALISALGRDVADIFRAQGETVEPVYTGERGGEFLAEIATLLTTAWTNKDIILSKMSALVSILTPLVLTARSLRHAYEQRIGKPLAQQKPLIPLPFFLQHNLLPSSTPISPLAYPERLVLLWTFAFPLEK
jgi:hypothetical protein